MSRRAGARLIRERYKGVILRVLEWDELGRPSRCQVVYDDQKIDLMHGRPRVIWTALVPEEMTQAQGPKGVN